METDTPRLFRDYKNPREFIKKIIGRKIVRIRRSGKNIIMELDNKSYLVFHLMMTGRLFLNPLTSLPHDRATLKLSGGNRLVFNDVRKFGRCRVLESSATVSYEEPLDITFARFKKILGRRKMAIKSLLLNQKILGGIGNIYSDEILWEAGIHPATLVGDFTDGQLGKLFRAVRSVLKLAIKRGGTSMRDYRKPDGSEGGYYKIRKVYNRAGEKCPRDGAFIQRMVMAQRSTHYCPHHQR